MEAWADFYSHALVGRDGKHEKAIKDYDNFYSHALVGRDWLLSPNFNILNISTHTPSWGVTSNAANVTIICNDFYSHALVGRDRMPKVLARTADISTHTPSWGVTRLPLLLFDMVSFLLTRPRGA